MKFTYGRDFEIWWSEVSWWELLPWNVKQLCHDAWRPKQQDSRTTEITS